MEQTGIAALDALMEDCAYFSEKKVSQSSEPIYYFWHTIEHGRSERTEYQGLIEVDGEWLVWQIWTEPNGNPFSGKRFEALEKTPLWFSSLAKRAQMILEEAGAGKFPLREGGSARPLVNRLVGIQDYIEKDRKEREEVRRKLDIMKKVGVSIWSDYKREEKEKERLQSAEYARELAAFTPADWTQEPYASILASLRAGGESETGLRDGLLDALRALDAGESEDSVKQRLKAAIAPSGQAEMKRLAETAPIGWKTDENLFILYHIAIGWEKLELESVAKRFKWTDGKLSAVQKRREQIRG